MALLRNVLIFHSGALGDLVLSFPLGLALARLHPTSRVRYVTTAGKGRLAQRVLGVEHVDVEGGFSSLFAEGTDVPPPVTSLLAGSHRIISFVAAPDSPWARRVAQLAPAAKATFASTIPPAPNVSAVDWLRQQFAGDRALAGAIDQILSLLTKQGLVRQGLAGRGVVVHPGAGSPAKCWPLDAFRELALRLKDRGQEVRWVLGEVERERLSPSERRALEVLGDVIVPESPEGLLEELASAAAFVGNDSGPGHLAAIAGVPTVTLYGPTDPAIWRPIGPHVQTLRTGQAVAEIPVDTVVENVLKLLG
jgi:ADP-heptose:LPS heptosyltransferase